MKPEKTRTREPKGKIIERIEKALQTPMSISDLGRILNKSEKVIRLCLKDMGEKVKYESKSNGRGMCHKYSLREDFKSELTTKLNFEFDNFNLNNTNHNLIDRTILRNEYLNDSERAILNWRDETLPDLNELNDLNELKLGDFRRLYGIF